MAQRIFIELLLFLTPFMVFLAYRAASRDMMIRDRWPLTMLVLIGAGIAILGLIIPPLLEPNERGKCFQAARYVDGKSIPAKEVPCAEVNPPIVEEGPTIPQSAPPIAPRDRGPN